MNFREITEVQEKLCNAAHTSAIMHMVETNGWNELDHIQKWIAAGSGFRPDMDCGRRCTPSGDGS